MSHYRSLLELAFASQFLLRLFQNSLVDHAIEGEFFIDDTGADVFIEHDLNAVLGYGEIGGIAGAEQIVSTVDDVGLAFESAGEAGLDRFLLVVTWRPACPESSL